MIKNIARNLVGLYLILALSGCATPPPFQIEAEKQLNSECLGMFLDSGVGRYQYAARSRTSRAVFALASDAAGQSCGMAITMASDIIDSAFFSLPNTDRLDAVAIQRCEQRKAAAIKAPCRVFARGNQIVWGK